MAHQDFEKYAVQRQMNGNVSDVYLSFFQKYVERHLGQDARILDFGCGDGKYFDFFSRISSPDNVHGVEISSTRVERCHSKGWLNVHHVKDGQLLPFNDDYFDLINFDQVIEHIPEDSVQFYLQEMKRVLRPDGRVIVITPNYPAKRLYDLHGAIRSCRIRKAFDDPTHVAKYSFNKLTSVLEQQFDVVTMEPTGGIFWRRLQRNILSHKIIALIAPRKGSRRVQS